MDRRHFLCTCLAAVSAQVCGCGSRWPRPAAPQVMTVRGPVAAARLDVVLPHEHVMVDFAGADEAGPARYDADAVFDAARPPLAELHRLGGRTLVECTPAYLGRDPVLLRRLSEATGLHILTNTGYYGARDDQHLPPHAFSDATDALAARWVDEWVQGLDGTGIRPGFIKIGVDHGALSEVDRKLVRAAARAHRETGLTLAVHTGPAEAAFEQLDVLAEEAVDPSAWIWVHAQAEQDLARHVRAAERGAWVEFDGLGPDTVDRHVELVSNMRQHNLLHRVLVSHDAGWYHVGEPGGGDFRAFNTLFVDFIPALRGAGFTGADVHRLTVANPAAAFGIRVRAAA